MTSFLQFYCCSHLKDGYLRLGLVYIEHCVLKLCGFVVLCGCWVYGVCREMQRSVATNPLLGSGWLGVEQC